MASQATAVLEKFAQKNHRMWYTWGIWIQSYLHNPPANNHYKMAGHVAPISRDISGNQPFLNGVVHFIL